MVKSRDIKIQVQFTDEYSWIKSLAVSGKILQNRKLLISADGTVTWDGAQVLRGFPSRFRDNFVNARYYKDDVFQSSTSGRAKRFKPNRHDSYELRTLEIRLPKHITLTVNVNDVNAHVKFLDVFISLPKPAGVCGGFCGKGNGDLSDDTEEHIMRQVDDLRVAPRESLFSRRLLLASNSQPPLTNRSNALSLQQVMCKVDMQQARVLCQKVLPADTAPAWLDACATDVCAGGEALANHAAMVAAQADDLLLKESRQGSTLALPTGDPANCHTCAPGEACFDDISWAMTWGVPSGHYSKGGFYPTIDSASCFEDVQRAMWEWQQGPDFFMGAMHDKTVPLPCGNAQIERYLKHGLTFCR